MAAVSERHGNAADSGFGAGGDRVGRDPVVSDVITGSEADRASWQPRAWQMLTAGLLLTLLWGVVLVGLTEVFAWGAWATQSLTVIAATVLSTALIAALLPRHRALTGWAGFVAGLATVAAWITAGGRGPDWWHSPGQMFELIGGQITEGTAPLILDGGFTDLILAVVLLLVTTTAVALVHFSHPLVAGIFTVLILLVSPAVTGASLDWSLLAAAGIVLTLLVWVGSPAPNPVGLLAATSAVAIAAAAVAIAPDTRDRVWNRSLTASPVASDIPDVTIALAADLRERSLSRAFSFTPSAAGAYRFTLATLADFEGGRWYPQDTPDPDRLSVLTPRTTDVLPPRMAPPRSAATHLLAQLSGLPITTVSVRIDGLLSSWLPLPQSALRVIEDKTAVADFDPQLWRWRAEANTAFADSDLTRRGYQYHVDAQQLIAGELPYYSELNEHPLVDLAALNGGGGGGDGGGGGVDADGDGQAGDPGAGGSAGGGGAAGDGGADGGDGRAELDEQLAQYLRLPADLPDLIASTAIEAVGANDDRLSVGRALQNYFRSGNFVYDESAPYEPGADPNDPYAIMQNLLTERSGFCVHYASSFAVMARSLGAPARVAIGYAVASDGGLTSVRGLELHAWPEIYLDGVGWVAFEPTPGGAGLRADTGVDVPPVPEADDNDGDSAEPVEPVDVAPVEDPSFFDEWQELNSGDSRGGLTRAQVAALLAVGGLGVLVLLTPMVVRQSRRVWRWWAVKWASAADHSGQSPREQLRRQSVGRPGGQVAGQFAGQTDRRADRQPVEHLWAECLDTAVDLGYFGTDVDEAARDSWSRRDQQPTALRARTPEAIVDYLSEHPLLSQDGAAGRFHNLEQLRSALRALVFALNAERYAAAGEAGAAEAAAVRTLAAHKQVIVRALRAGAGSHARTRAFWLPRSVLRRSAEQYIDRFVNSTVGVA